MRLFGGAKSSTSAVKDDADPHAAAASDDSTERTLRGFAAGMAHEFRTPLTALSGEIELALRRQRSVREYQQALERIAERTGELIEMTADLALLADPAAGAREASAVRVDTLFASVAAQIRGSASDPLLIDAARLDSRILGDARLLGRALVLLVQHAWRHRRPAARIHLRCAHASSAVVPILIEASPGFTADAWDGIRSRDGADRSHAPGQLRLRTAARIVGDAGGSIDVIKTARGEAVQVRLPQA